MNMESWRILGFHFLLRHTKLQCQGFLDHFGFSDVEAAVKQDTGLTGILCATLAGNLEMLRVLVQNRADPNGRCDGLVNLGYYDTQTVLMVAAKSHQDGLLRFFHGWWWDKWMETLKWYCNSLVILMQQNVDSTDCILFFLCSVFQLDTMKSNPSTQCMAYLPTFIIQI